MKQNQTQYECVHCRDTGNCQPCIGSGSTIVNQALEAGVSVEVLGEMEEENPGMFKCDPCNGNGLCPHCSIVEKDKGDVVEISGPDFFFVIDKRNLT